MDSFAEHAAAALQLLCWALLLGGVALPAVRRLVVAPMPARRAAVDPRRPGRAVVVADELPYAGPDAPRTVSVRPWSVTVPADLPSRAPPLRHRPDDAESGLPPAAS